MFSCSTARADILYRETFGRPAGATGNINPTNFYWSHWTALGARDTRNNGISADGTGKPQDLESINAGANVDGTFGPYPEGWHYLDNNVRLTFTAEYSFNPVDYIPGSILFHWYQGNAYITNGLYLIVRSGDAWYVSTRAITNTSPVANGPSFGLEVGGAEQVFFPFDPAAANWRVLNFDGTFDPATGIAVSSTFGEPVAGAPASSDLTGTISGFGLFRTHNNGQNSRFDTYTIEATPVPLVFGKEAIWVGNVNGDWDQVTANWRTNGGGPTTYTNLDFAWFDDTATGETNINLVGALRPASIVVSNDTLTYKLSGDGHVNPVLGLTKSGPGLFTIDNSGPNSMAAGVFIQAGTLQIGSGGTNGSLGSGNITNDASLVINRSGSLVMNNTISGTGSLTKNGDGNLALGGSLSYAGTTTVNGGTLLLNGTLSGGGAITTAAGTTLGGNGTSAGAVNASGLIYPGNANAAGTLTVGAVTLGAGATLKFDLSNNNTAGGAFNDLLQVNGDLTAVNNTIIVNFIGYPQTDVPYRLVNYNGLLIGTFNPVIAGTHYVAVLDESTPGQINVTFSGTGASLKWNSTSSSVWDLGTTANWLNLTTSLPDVFYAGDTVLFDDSVTGVQTSVTLASGISAAPTAVTVNSAQHFTFSGAGRITGPATILKQGAGTLTLSNASDFTGAVTIEGGTVRAGSGTAFGTGAAGITIVDGATLDVNGQNLTAEAVTVSGAGVDGKGAIVNNGPEQQSALRTLTLAGDTTLGGTGRWDMRNTGGAASLSTGGGAYNLAKVGTNQISLVAVSAIDTLLGDIDIQEGMFAIQTTTVQVGDPLGVITVHPGATLGLWNLNAAPLDKLMSFHDGATLLNENGRSIIQGAGNVLGTLTINAANAGTTPSLTLNTSFDGSGGITKIGAGPLIINGLHFYGGPTVVSNGIVFVDGQIPATSSLTVYGGGTLAGAGQVSAPIIIEPNGTLAPGGATTAIATLTAENSLILGGTNAMDINKAGATITSDLISGLTSLTYGGTLRLTLGGAVLAGGDIISLYSFGSASGAFSSIIPATPGLGLQWDTSQLTVNGTLRVLPPSGPRANSTSVAGGSLTISGTNGPANWSYRVLTSTDAALPVANWSPYHTNFFGPDGSFTFGAPIEPGTPQRFFILVLP